MPERVAYIHLSESLLAYLIEDAIFFTQKVEYLDIPLFKLCSKIFLPKDSPPFVQLCDDSGEKKRRMFLNPSDYVRYTNKMS